MRTVQLEKEPIMTRKWWTLTAVCMGIFMLLLDITVVNVALPSIARSLGASFDDLQWVVDAYALTLAALLLAAGSLADRIGRRAVFATGLGVFTLSSLACALAPDALFLILARAVQGIGGAAMFATSLSLLAQEFQGRDRGTAFGIYGATTGASVALGPVLGGVLTTGLGWHAIFLLNIPIGLATIALTLTRVAETRNPSAGRLDWPGFATFSAALAAFVFALIRGNALGWSSPLIVACLFGAASLLMLFIVIERRRAEPMLDLRLFATPTFSGASVAAFATPPRSSRCCCTSRSTCRASSGSRRSAPGCGCSR
jgi:EmrB/QacA subfamily drug resistance transporter